MLALMVAFTGCGYHFIQAKQDKPFLHKTISIKYDTHTPADLIQQLVAMLQARGMTVANTSQKTTNEIYAISIVWTRQKISRYLANDNFAVIMQVNATYNVRVHEESKYFIPNKLLQIKSEKWELRYVQSQADTANSALYSYQAENSLFNTSIYNSLLQQLESKLRIFVAETKNLTVENYDPEYNR